MTADLADIRIEQLARCLLTAGFSEWYSCYVIPASCLLLARNGHCTLFNRQFGVIRDFVCVFDCHERRAVAFQLPASGTFRRSRAGTKARWGAKRHPTRQIRKRRPEWSPLFM